MSYAFPLPQGSLQSVTDVSRLPKSSPSVSPPTPRSKISTRPSHPGLPNKTPPTHPSGWLTSSPASAAQGIIATAFIPTTEATPRWRTSGTQPSSRHLRRPRQTRPRAFKWRGCHNERQSAEEVGYDRRLVLSIVYTIMIEIKKACFPSCMRASQHRDRRLHWTVNWNVCVTRFGTIYYHQLITATCHQVRS